MAKQNTKRDEAREDRIHMEIIADANGPEEQAMGWYYYLQDQLKFPFTAECVAKRSISPLHVKDKVDVIDMPGEDECEHEMFVAVRWNKESLAVPLSQLKPTGATDDQTKQAVDDWHFKTGTIGSGWATNSEVAPIAAQQ